MRFRRALGWVREGVEPNEGLDEGFARRDLYTWTTRAQIGALAAGGELLVASGQGITTPYQRALQRLAASGGPSAPIARMLLPAVQLALTRRCR